VGERGAEGEGGVQRAEGDEGGGRGRGLGGRERGVQKKDLRHAFRHDKGKEKRAAFFKGALREKLGKANRSDKKKAPGSGL